MRFSDFSDTKSFSLVVSRNGDTHLDQRSTRVLPVFGFCTTPYFYDPFWSSLSQFSLALLCFFISLHSARKHHCSIFPSLLLFFLHAGLTLCSLPFYYFLLPTWRARFWTDGKMGNEGSIGGKDEDILESRRRLMRELCFCDARVTTVEGVLCCCCFSLIMPCNQDLRSFPRYFHLLGFFFACHRDENLFYTILSSTSSSSFFQSWIALAFARLKYYSPSPRATICLSLLLRIDTIIVERKTP